MWPPTVERPVARRSSGGSRPTPVLQGGRLAIRKRPLANGNAAQTVVMHHGERQVCCAPPKVLPQLGTKRPPVSRTWTPSTALPSGTHSTARRGVRQEEERYCQAEGDSPHGNLRRRKSGQIGEWQVRLPAPASVCPKCVMQATGAPRHDMQAPRPSPRGPGRTRTIPSDQAWSAIEIPRGLPIA